MMGVHQMLWMLVLTFSTWSAFSGTARRSSTNDTHQQTTLPYTEVQVVSPSDHLLSPTDEGEERGQLPPVAEDGSEIYTVEKNLISSAAVFSEVVNTPSKWMESMGRSLKILEKESTWNLSMLSTDVPGVSDELVAVVKEVLREACGAGYRQKAVLQDILHLSHLQQVSGILSGPYPLTLTAKSASVHYTTSQKLLLLLLSNSQNYGNLCCSQ